MGDPVASASAALAERWRQESRAVSADVVRRPVHRVGAKWSHPRRHDPKDALAYDPTYCDSFIQDAIAVVYRDAGRWTKASPNQKRPTSATRSNNRPASAARDRPVVLERVDVPTMVYRTPMFKARYLQVLEAETYKLLDTTDVRWPPRHPAPCGPGHAAVRQHHGLRRPQSAGVGRIRPATSASTPTCQRLKRACRTIYKFVCKYYLIRKHKELLAASTLEQEEHRARNVRRQVAASRIQRWFKRSRRRTASKKSPKKAKSRLKKKQFPVARTEREKSAATIARVRRREPQVRPPTDIVTEAVNTYLLARLLNRPANTPKRKRRPPRQCVHSPPLIFVLVASILVETFCPTRCPPRYAVAAHVLSIRRSMGPMTPTKEAPPAEQMCTKTALQKTNIVPKLPGCVPPENVTDPTESGSTAAITSAPPPELSYLCTMTQGELLVTASEPMVKGTPDAIATEIPLSTAASAATLVTADKLQLLLFREKSQATLQQCLAILADDSSDTISDVRDASTSGPDDEDVSLWCDPNRLIGVDMRTANTAAITIQRTLRAYAQKRREALTTAPTVLPPIAETTERYDIAADDDEYAIALSPVKHDDLGEDASGLSPAKHDEIGDWREAMDEGGNLYYYNTVTNETSWQPPLGWAVTSLWETCVDASGTVFYYNRATNESSWELPSA
ncbi:hypothetical protein ACHHYP_05800 [Achlya hypogyna]|uniref:WW domain-containing protein n=1 Tax=Achlya hypogyna TaxID=1202772 RepID=A0A1V9YWE9_ACHHY|nr:hypothetical protein ACHHYP_05800 [Achlya hypogyna]